MPSFAGDGGERDLLSSVSADCCFSFLKLAARSFHVHYLSHLCCHHLFVESQRTSYRPCVLRDTKNSPFPSGAPGNLRQPTGQKSGLLSQTYGVSRPSLNSRTRGITSRAHEQLRLPFGFPTVSSPHSP